VPRDQTLTGDHDWRLIIEGVNPPGVSRLFGLWVDASPVRLDVHTRQRGPTPGSSGGTLHHGQRGVTDAMLAVHLSRRVFPMFPYK
jgi:hypothetical protein